jgi:hypothetical protein
MQLPARVKGLLWRFWHDKAAISTLASPPPGSRWGRPRPPSHRRTARRWPGRERDRPSTANSSRSTWRPARSARRATPQARRRAQSQGGPGHEEEAARLRRRVEARPGPRPPARPLLWRPPGLRGREGRHRGAVKTMPLPRRPEEVAGTASKHSLKERLPQKGVITPPTILQKSSP